MSRKIFSAVLALLMLLSAFLTACSPDDPTVTPSDTPVPTSPESPSGTPAETPTETEPPIEPTPDIDPTADGTLWYYEDFEKYELSGDSTYTANALGWDYDRTTDATIRTNTAQYHIADKDGSRQLYIKNYDGAKDAKDSFITILSDRQFSYLHKLNYTYQYDLTYDTSYEKTRYIVLVSEYNGSDYYNSAHVRSGGYANHECKTGEEWRQYDSTIPSSGSKSLASRLLGKSVEKNALKDISISIRYVVNWQDGHNVYVRVNTEGYPGTGVWTQIGKYDAGGNAVECLDPERGGAAMAFKVGGRQNGYIDNIMIWCGNGDEPTDKDFAILTSKTACHRFYNINGERICVLCQKTEEEAKEGWLLDGIPQYDGGAYSDNVYLAGQGLVSTLPLALEAKLQIISSTSAAEFNAYIDKLEGENYELEYTRDADGNLFRSYIKGTVRVYAYYIAATREARVIRENANMSLSADKFGYKYTPKGGESSEIYQYGLPMVDAAHTWGAGFVDRGMLYVIKLADDSVIIIDGGEATQFPESQVDNLMAFLREITDVGETGKVKIAAWYLTHPHGDHMQGFGLLLKKYHESLELERVIYNVTSAHSDDETAASNGQGVKKIIKYINQYYTGVKFIKPHTGMKIQLADITIETLYTHEDLVDPFTGKTEMANNSNEASMISMITFGVDKKFLLTGDIDARAASIAIENWKPETLRADVLQMAHHVLNDLSGLYNIVQAPFVFVTQSRFRIAQHKVSPDAIETVLKYASADNLFYQNEHTVGVGVVDGEIKKIYTRDVVYEVKDGSW